MLAKKYIISKPEKPDNLIRHTHSSQAMLALEAMRLRYAFMYDPVLAMSVSKVDPLPHQIEAVYGYVLKKPRIRFMLAHDPGAGKTIMAGLIIKELKLRGGHKAHTDSGSRPSQRTVEMGDEGQGRREL